MARISTLPEALSPRAFGERAFAVPLETTKLPVKELLPDTTIVPSPVFTMPPAPEIEPEMVRVVPEATSMVTVRSRATGPVIVASAAKTAVSPAEGMPWGDQLDALAQTPSVPEYVREAGAAMPISAAMKAARRE